MKSGVTRGAWVAFFFMAWLVCVGCHADDDGRSDLEPSAIWYKDSDGDGYSDGSMVNTTKQPREYYSERDLRSLSGDCDDADPLIHPEATETCGDGLDQNCDGRDPECDDDECAGPWYRANLTTYTSYPDPGSEECLEYNGCTWAGYFYGLEGQQTGEWVAAHNIVAVHHKDWGWLGMKTIRLHQDTHDILATVYDLCSDSDCDGCCTENLGGDGYLIDIEHATMERFGSGEGIVEFQVCGANHSGSF
ncbi:putative metal-binding motif-containing protein [Endothiovibrio diazotrophicus]